MTDVEILLSAESGWIPAGSVAFFMRDRSLGRRRAAAVLSGLAFLSAVAVALLQGTHAWVLSLALVSAIFAVLATPTFADGARIGGKRPVLVITPTMILLRDDRGLRRWAFDELALAQVSPYADRLDLILVARDGTRSFIDCRNFDRGDGVVRAIAPHVPTAVV
jgi:hypothetical protein